MKAVATLIYRNVFCGGGGTAFRCSVCKIHVVIGICPRFCPACGVKFTEWLDAGIDLAERPETKWSEDIPTKPLEYNEGCGLANPPKPNYDNRN